MTVTNQPSVGKWSIWRATSGEWMVGCPDRPQFVPGAQGFYAINLLGARLTHGMSCRACRRFRRHAQALTYVTAALDKDA